MTLLFSKYFLGSFLVMLSLKNNGKKVGTIFLCQQEWKEDKLAKTIPLD